MMSLSSCCRPSHGDSSGTAATTELMGRCVPVWWPGDCDSNPLLSSVEGPQIEFMVGQVLIKRVLPKTEICSFHVTQNSFFFFGPERVSFAQAGLRLTRQPENNPELPNPAFTSLVLGQQTRTTTPGLHGAGNETQGFMHAKPVLCPLS